MQLPQQRHLQHPPNAPITPHRHRPHHEPLSPHTRHRSLPHQAPPDNRRCMPSLRIKSRHDRSQQHRERRRRNRDRQAQEEIIRRPQRRGCRLWSILVHGTQLDARREEEGGDDRACDLPALALVSLFGRGRGGYGVGKRGLVLDGLAAGDDCRAR